MSVKRAMRVAVCVLWGAVLMLAPGVARTMGESGSLPFGYYLWTSAIPLAFVAASLAWAVRSRFSRWRRALGVAALAALRAYLVVLFASCTGSMRLGFALRLDEERCVLYLRGRGAGELQAHVLLKIALGLSTPEVCEALHVAPGTVNAYRAQGYELLGVHTSRQLAALLARDVGLIPSAGKNSPLADDSDTSV
ncbi:LuxR C-terminal-related transcriptional regulator [Thermophilibacter sp.]|uniref:LuxR C-terminal-related transcriptional regulator n=1 Tax=Thermophilibacter sp. TaxID=2847309 RepID=UPI003A94B21A